MFKIITTVGFAILIAHITTLWSQGNPVTSLQPKFQEEVKSLTTHPGVLHAFEMIQKNDTRTVQEHILLTEIPAPPFKEMERAIKFKSMLEEAGLDSVWIDQVGNVLGLKRGIPGNKTVVLDAHMDTVFPEGTDVNVKIKGDTFYAPGISDDTRGLAMVLAVARAMIEANIETDSDILFIGSVGEEGMGDLRGVKHLFSTESRKIDSWISIDGGRIGRVNNKALGSYRYRVAFSGPGGHSWGAFGLVNPHHAIGSAIHYFVRDANAFTLDGPRTSYNIGRVGGGTSINSVPFSSWMEVDMRSVDPGRLVIMEKLLYSAVHKAWDEQNTMARLGDSLSVVIDKVGLRPSGELSEGLPIIQRAIASTAYFGKRPELTIGSTNSNIPISMGIPSVTIGRGGHGRNAHSLDEWWVNEEGYKAIQLALLLLVAESGLSK